MTRMGRLFRLFDEANRAFERSQEAYARGDMRAFTVAMIEHGMIRAAYTAVKDGVA